MSSSDATENGDAVLTKVTRVPIALQEQVADQIRLAIMRMKLTAGQRLTERYLADMTGVSRATIREVLHHLAAQGLVESFPGSGWRIASPTRKQAEDLYMVRASLEGLAGRLFAERASDEQVRRLREVLTEIETIPLDQSAPAAILERKEEFYDVLFEGTDNSAITSIMISLRARSTLLRMTSLSEPGRPEVSVHELRAIVSAAERRDADAMSNACVYHVQQAATAAFRRGENSPKESQKHPGDDEPAATNDVER